MPVLLRPHQAPGPRPIRGIKAQVLIDGFSPGAAKERFSIGMERRQIADYLLAGERGFSRVIPISQHPPYGFIFLLSAPESTDQFRVAFGLTLLEDALETGSRMGLKLLIGGRASPRFIQPSEAASSIRFLEAIEGVDQMEVRFRYRISGTLVKGDFVI